MADPTPATPAAPATPASPAVNQRFVEPDMLMRLKVDGKELVVPAAEAVKDIQLAKASYDRMAKAERIVQEAKANEEPAKKYRDLEELRKRNPSQFLEEMERWAGVQRDASLSTEHTTLEQQAPNTRDALKPVLDRLAHLESRTYQTELEGDIQRTLDSYPLFRQNAKAREMAKVQIAASILASQKTGERVEIGDVAKDVHTMLFESGVQAATSERDARQQHQQTMPSIPSQIGIPDMSGLPKLTGKDIKTPGAVGARLREVMQRFAGQAGGNV